MSMSQRMWKREQERKRRERLKRARRRRNCAIAVFIAAVVAVIVIVSKSCDDSSVPLSETGALTSAPVTTPTPFDSKPFVSAVDASEINLSKFENSVFVGNSLAESIDMYNILPETDFYSSVNLDLENVYTTAADNDSMAVADQLKSKKFNRIYLCFGERELAWNNASKFGTEYREFIDKVKEYQSSASIYVISIPPIEKSVSDANENGMNITTIKEYNRRIRNMAYSENLYYVDSMAALGRNGGYLVEGSSYDGINLNNEYVTALVAYIDDKAYIPSTPASDIDEAEEVVEPEPTPKPAEVDHSENEEEPQPTVNVLKDSAIKDREKN